MNDSSRLVSLMKKDLRSQSTKENDTYIRDIRFTSLLCVLVTVQSSGGLLGKKPGPGYCFPLPFSIRAAEDTLLSGSKTRKDFMMEKQ